MLFVLAPLLLRLFVVEAFRIPSAGMAPALEPGDHVFVDKTAYAADADPDPRIEPHTIAPRGYW